MSIFFRVAYLVGFKPWDSGVSPPELVDVVEGDNRLAPGKALDLGCGTGTNCIYLAQHGWDATGVDFVPRAIRTGKRKVAAAGVSPRLLVGDVTRLSDLGIGTGYRLLLDIGCFHSLPDTSRDAYVKGATEVAEPGALMLLFCFMRPEKPPRFSPRGVALGEVEQRFASGWEPITREEGRPMFGSEAAWYRLRRA